MPRGANLRGSLDTSDRYSVLAKRQTVSGAVAGRVASAAHRDHSYDMSPEVAEAAAAVAHSAASSGSMPTTQALPPAACMEVAKAIEPLDALQVTFAPAATTNNNKQQPTSAAAAAAGMVGWHGC